MGGFRPAVNRGVSGALEMTGAVEAKLGFDTEYPAQGPSQHLSRVFSWGSSPLRLLLLILEFAGTHLGTRPIFVVAARLAELRS